MNKIKGISAMGTYFGYPECCQKYFFNRGYYDTTDFPLMGTGYIPCLSCRKKSEKELIKHINENRFCNKSFPNGTAVTRKLEYTKQFSKFLESFEELI
jgi:hypothetical protein